MDSIVGKKLVPSPRPGSDLLFFENNEVLDCEYDGRPMKALGARKVPTAENPSAMTIIIAPPMPKEGEVEFVPAGEVFFLPT